MQIYYFSRTGRSKEVAQALAKAQGADARPIDDGKNWSGMLGYIKAALAAIGAKGLPATYEPPADGERIAVVFPVWAGRIPPAVKRFAQELGRERITAIPTSLGSKLNDRDGFAGVIDLVGKEIQPPTELS